MGELSIVIEDESNMINLWDFAHNPAGFLADEKRSVIRVMTPPPRLPTICWVCVTRAWRREIVPKDQFPDAT